MAGFILTFHFIICIFMIIVVLLQAGKGADVGAAFGGGSQTVFGPRGAATLLSKVTTGAAILFLLTSIILANLAKEQSSTSVIKGAKLPPSKIAETQKAETQKSESQKAESKKVEVKSSESLKTEKKEELTATPVIEKTVETQAAETQKALTPRKKSRSRH